MHTACEVHLPSRHRSGPKSKSPLYHSNQWSHVRIRSCSLTFKRSFTSPSLGPTVGRNCQKNQRLFLAQKLNFPKVRFRPKNVTSFKSFAFSWNWKLKIAFLSLDAFPKFENIKYHSVYFKTDFWQKIAHFFCFLRTLKILLQTKKVPYFWSYILSTHREIKVPGS